MNILTVAAIGFIITVTTLLIIVLWIGETKAKYITRMIGIFYILYLFVVYWASLMYANQLK